MAALLFRSQCGFRLITFVNGNRYINPLWKKKERNDRDWYIYLQYLMQGNVNNTHKNVQKSSKTFKSNIAKIYGFPYTLFAL